MKNYTIRLARPEDLRFVVKTWLDSYRASHTAGLLSLSPHFEACPACLEAIDYGYSAVMEKIVRRLLHRPDVEVFVASNPRAAPPNDLHGYIVVERNPLVPFYRPPHYALELRESEHPLVHYVLVKKIYRRFGVARALFKAAGIDPTQKFLFTCTTPISEQIRKAFKTPKAEWSPLCARFAKETSKVHDSQSPSAPIHEAGARADAGECP